MNSSSLNPQDHGPPPTLGTQTINHIAPPEDPPPAYDPPSYDDATHSPSSPLLVGPRFDYGTHRAYQSREASTVASSEIEESSRSLPEWVGQALVVFVFVGIIYCFWKLVNDPDIDGFPG